MTVKLRISLVLLVVLCLAAALYLYSHAQTSKSGEDMPNYNAPLTVSTELTSDQRASLDGQFDAIKTALASSTNDFNAWVALGSVRKVAGDYKGAEEVWIYVARSWPTETIPFNNLGDLYMNYLKDFPKAEESYQKVIAINPQNISGYENLFNLYRYLYKTDTTAAADILAQGLKANPGNAYLLQLETQLGEEK